MRGNYVIQIATRSGKTAMMIDQMVEAVAQANPHRVVIRSEGAHALILTRDPDSGSGGLYLDGNLIFDFYDRDPLVSTLNLTNHWDEALDALAEALGWTFDTESRHMLSRPIQSGPFEVIDYDGYWPERLEQAPKVEP